MKRTLIIMLSALIAGSILAGERTVEDAAALAAQFTNQHPTLRLAHKAPRTAGTMRLAHTRAKIGSEAPAFYVFNQENNGGFVIVSADDRTEDILVYGEEGQFDEQTINPNFRFWLEWLQEQVSLANDENAIDHTLPRKATTAIGPLLKNKNGKSITWEQKTPYNNLAPMDKWDNTRAMTGCVATAMAQIMYMWRWPERGEGKKTYVWQNANKSSQQEKLTVNFSDTPYDWDNMLPAYEGKTYNNNQALAVATLMYHCGVACEMEWGGDRAGGSGAFTDYMGDGLMKHLRYNVEKFITTYSEYAYTEGGKCPSPMDNAEYSVAVSEFETLFNRDLELGRPIIMGGESSQGGHEFVCDGRDTQGRFHINWGWEGESNCYCALTNLKPSGKSYNFSRNIDALVGVYPNEPTATREQTAQSEIVGVFDIMGRRVADNLDHVGRGIYIVKTADATTKIIL